MAIAVVDHKALLTYIYAIGFPKATKVALVPEGVGYRYFDSWIRDNVKWVSQLEFDPVTQVRITESAQLKGEIPEAWVLRHQQYLEGESENNAFKALAVNDGVELTTHVNRNAIRTTVQQVALKYQVDYHHAADGSVDTESRLAVAVFDNAEDTSLSYTSDLLVEQLWTTRLVEHDGVPYLEKRAYFNDPKVEDSYPWIQVGPLNELEVELWRLHNLPQEDAFTQMQQLDVRKISDTLVTPKTGIAHLAR